MYIKYCIYIILYIYTYVSTKPYSDITYKATNITNLQLAHSQSSPPGRQVPPGSPTSSVHQDVPAPWPVPTGGTSTENSPRGFMGIFFWAAGWKFWEGLNMIKSHQTHWKKAHQTYQNVFTKLNHGRTRSHRAKNCWNLVPFGDS